MGITAQLVFQILAIAAFVVATVFAALAGSVEKVGVTAAR